jgi:Asp-tRNA(Asn)/Glu-tRNA(Gln) amidotransferase A subunit family amidase
MFIGRPFAEATLIKFAAAYQFAAMTRKRKRVRPCIQSNIELDV